MALAGSDEGPNGKREVRVWRGEDHDGVALEGEPASHRRWGARRRCAAVTELPLGIVPPAEACSLGTDRAGMKSSDSDRLKRRVVDMHRIRQSDQSGCKALSTQFAFAVVPPAPAMLRQVDAAAVDAPGLQCL